MVFMTGKSSRDKGSVPAASSLVQFVAPHLSLGGSEEAHPRETAGRVFGETRTRVLLQAQRHREPLHEETIPLHFRGSPTDCEDRIRGARPDLGQRPGESPSILPRGLLRRADLGKDLLGEVRDHGRIHGHAPDAKASAPPPQGAQPLRPDKRSVILPPQAVIAQTPGRVQAGHPIRSDALDAPRVLQESPARPTPSSAQQERPERVQIGSPATHPADRGIRRREPGSSGRIVLHRLDRKAPGAVPPGDHESRVVVGRAGIRFAPPRNPQVSQTNSDIRETRSGKFPDGPDGPPGPNISRGPCEGRPEVAGATNTVHPRFDGSAKVIRRAQPHPRVDQRRTTLPRGDVVGEGSVGTYQDVSGIHFSRHGILSPDRQRQQGPAITQRIGHNAEVTLSARPAVPDQGAMKGWRPCVQTGCDQDNKQRADRHSIKLPLRATRCGPHLCSASHPVRGRFLSVQRFRMASPYPHREPQT